MVYSFRTIQAEARGVFKEKGSKFLSFAYAVATEHEIRNILEKLRSEYFDARHHCYAWVLGGEKKHYRAVDDGEPGHSAGDPILGQIRSRDLTNVLIVVVRYFGGVKLGVGGLISAYKTAAEEALNHAEIVVREVYERVEISFDYDSTTEVMRLVKTFNLKIVQQGFSAVCTLEADLPLRHKENFEEKIKLMQALGSSTTIRAKSVIS